MKGAPRPSSIPPWELPGVQEIRKTPRPEASVGLDWAAAVFCTFGAPPALVLAGLLHAGSSPVGFWLAACGFFFAGLLLSLRLRPLPPRPVFRATSERGAGTALPELAEIGVEAEDELPNIRAGMSRSEILEQLAKLREQGVLSNAEYDAALHRLLGE